MDAWVYASSGLPQGDHLSGPNGPILNAVTGWNASLFELMKAAERGTMMQELSTVSKDLP